MEHLLKNTKGFVYEECNSFEDNSLPCHYYKKDNGYVVFFKIKGGIYDFGVYDNQKELIAIFQNIDQSINIDWRVQFINRAIRDTGPKQLKLYNSKF